MHLFLSPHPDDAPLSCGGTIYHLREAEEQTCIILTIMSGDPPDPLPDSPLVRELHERWQAGENPMATRRKEDEEAATVLSAKSIIHTSMTDCIYRTTLDGKALYPVESSINGDVHPLDGALLSLLSVDLPFTDQVTHVYAPLGVGHHVDHQIIRDWAVALSEKYPAITFLLYEDYPYAERPDATEQALAYYSLKLQPEFKTLREIDLMIKLVSLQHYTSQISTFWGSIQEMDERVRQFMTRTGDMVGAGSPVERYWRIVR
ncbi:MAG TPA: PIG-L family deacetylase [Phototrophicaceae bacterium]|jgi:LmbE family N-acetylglucosaminyl deacetylase|nr:PIG-L family deacetylase [Phototrophicaceae bacterium]